MLRTSSPCPLEVLRISTVVDLRFWSTCFVSFGSTKNFYCCRCRRCPPVLLPLEVLRISTVVDIRLQEEKQNPLEVLRISTVVDLGPLRWPRYTFGSTKNFYCCRFVPVFDDRMPLEVLRISTVVDWTCPLVTVPPLEVLRISTVVDTGNKEFTFSPFGSTKNFYCCRLPLF